MKIREFILVPKTIQDTTSCGTTSSGQKAGSKQDLVSHDLVPEMIDGAMVSHPDHSAITEGVSQILRRVAGKGLKQGFRCTSGPRKGRIVAKPSTCFARKDTKRAYKIAKKRQQKARQTGLKMGITKRARPGSTRLKSAQLKRKSGFKTRGKTSRFQKSKVIK